MFFFLAYFNVAGLLKCKPTDRSRAAWEHGGDGSLPWNTGEDLQTLRECSMWPLLTWKWATMLLQAPKTQPRGWTGDQTCVYLPFKDQVHIYDPGEYSFTVLKVVKCTCLLVAQSCPTLCNCMDCSLPGSSVHGILQARILEWVAIPFSRGSFWPRNQTHLSCIVYLGTRKGLEFRSPQAVLSSYVVWVEPGSSYILLQRRNRETWE